MADGLGRNCLGSARSGRSEEAVSAGLPATTGVEPEPETYRLLHNPLPFSFRYSHFSFLANCPSRLELLLLTS